MLQRMRVQGIDRCAQPGRSLIYSTEKTLRELGDKVESGIKEKLMGL